MVTPDRVSAISSTAPAPSRASDIVRVLAVIATDDVSGPARQLAALIPVLASYDIDVQVAVLQRTGRPHPPYATYLEREGLRFHIVEDRGRLDLGIADRLARLMVDVGCQIVQTHSYKATAALWWLRRRISSMPWIGFYHGHTTETLRARMYHRLDRRMLSAADQVVVMSDRQRLQFRERSRVRVIHNAVVPLAPGSLPSGLTARVEDRSAGPRIGVIGRLSPEKGVDVFLDACAILARQDAAFSALIVGDGPERSALDDRAASLGLLPRRVLFAGHVSASRDLYEALDLVVIPSRTEGLPNVLLEAIGMDTFVVATSVGAIPDVLAGTRAGTLVAPGDPRALADAIQDALVNADRDAIRQDQAALRERFSLGRRAALHAEMYRALLDRSIDSEPRVAGTT